MMNSNTPDEVNSSFDQAALFVQETISSEIDSLQDEQKLTLYGLFKQATSGPVSTSQPSILFPKDRAKWTAWNEAKHLSQEEAKDRYVSLMDSWFPDWRDSEVDFRPVGPVFSRPIEAAPDSEETSPSKDLFQQLKDCHDEEEMKKVLQSRPHIVLDNLGRTALHWAADKDCLAVIEPLLQYGGLHINIQDNDLMTPLHYAVLCGYQQLAYKLVEFGAGLEIPDNSGETPRDLLPSDWILPVDST